MIALQTLPAFVFILKYLWVVKSECSFAWTWQLVTITEVSPSVLFATHTFFMCILRPPAWTYSYSHWLHWMRSPWWGIWIRCDGNHCPPVPPTLRTLPHIPMLCPTFHYISQGIVCLSTYIEGINLGLRCSFEGLSFRRFESSRRPEPTTQTLFPILFHCYQTPPKTTPTWNKQLVRLKAKIMSFELTFYIGNTKEQLIRKLFSRLRNWF